MSGAELVSISVFVLLGTVGGTLGFSEESVIKNLPEMQETQNGNAVSHFMG